MGLVLAGGRVVDPGLGLDGPADIRLEGGRIVAVGRVVPAPGDTVRDVSGCCITPSLIDCHVHCYEGIGFFGIDPDAIGMETGVGTVVDAGSAGAATFEGMRRYVMARARTRVLCFLNLSLIGLPVGPRFGELQTLQLVDEVATERVVEENRGAIVGIKVRATRTALGALGLEPLRRARALADRVHLPIMVHIGDPEQHPEPAFAIPDVLSHLRAGDVVTHVLTAQPGGILDANGRLHQEVREAEARGIRFDVAHGIFNLSFDAAARILDQGLRPHTISTDLGRATRHRTIFDLPTTMAKFLALGFRLPEVVDMVTYQAAHSLGRPDLVSGLAAGREADLTVLRLEEGDWDAEDSMGATMQAHTRLVPVLAVRGETVVEAAPPVRQAPPTFELIRHELGRDEPGHRGGPAV